MGAVLKIGAANNVSLKFNQDVIIEIPTDLPDGTVVQVIRSEDSDAWTTLTTVIVKDGKITFTTNRFSYFAVYAPRIAGLVGTKYHFAAPKAAARIAFNDISGHWAEAYIARLRDLGIVSGKSATRFAPNDFITRAELTKMAVNAFKIATPAKVTKRPFADVAITAWYAPYVQAAKDRGIVQGLANNNLLPNTLITRVEALRILLEAAGKKGLEDTGAFTFMDVPVGSWFAKYVGFAKDHGIVGGYANGTFGPGKSITRAEVAKIVTKLLDLK